MTTIHSNDPLTVGEMMCIQDNYDMKYYRVIECEKQSKKWISHPRHEGSTGLYHITLEELK